MSPRTALQIEQEAADWVAVIDREGRAAAVSRGLDSWLSEDSRCVGALLQAETAWRMLDGLNPTHSAGVVVPISSKPTRKATPSRRWFLGATAAASVAGIAALGALWFQVARGQRVRTAVGEIRRVPLADGSTAAVNTTSELVMRVEKKTRSIMLDSGEAFFEVKKDAARPFIVEAGDVRVMAVGTAFSVRKLPDAVEVIVTEGTVEAWVVGAKDSRTRISAGGRATLTASVAIDQRTIGQAEAARALAWRDGRVDFAGETLADAAAEFNRYNTRQIVIADAALAKERFYGRFHTDDVEGFAEAVHQTLNASVAMGPSEITIGEPTARP